MAKLMSKEDFLKSKEYAEYMRRIRNYPKGYVLHFPIHKMSQPIVNALNVILQNAVKEGLMESVEDGWGWDENGDFKLLEMTYRKL